MLRRSDTHELRGSDTDELVSVVIPTYERNQRLRETLDSVAAQEHEPIETIVVDGADDDRARPVVAEFPDARYVSQPEGDDGPQAARSLGVEHASGEYVQLLDDDDRLAPGKIRKQVELLEPPVGVVYCGMIDEDRGEIPPNPAVRGNVIEHALEMRTFPCITSTMLVDRDVIERVHPFRHRHGADDTGLKVDLALATEFDFVAEPLVYRGRPESSLSESWAYLDGRETVVATFDRLYDRFPDRIRRRAVRETRYQAGLKLLDERGWSPRATVEFARAARLTPDDRAYHLAACLGSALGRPGVVAVDRLFGRE